VSSKQSTLGTSQAVRRVPLSVSTATNKSAKSARGWNVLAPTLAINRDRSAMVFACIERDLTWTANVVARSRRWKMRSTPSCVADFHTREVGGSKPPAPMGIREV
jgi:hypothetical protein